MNEWLEGGPFDFRSIEIPIPEIIGISWRIPFKTRWLYTFFRFDKLSKYNNI